MQSALTDHVVTRLPPRHHDTRAAAPNTKPRMSSSPPPPAQRPWSVIAMLVALVVLALLPVHSYAYTSSSIPRQRGLSMKDGAEATLSASYRTPALASCSRADVLRGGMAVLSGAALTSLGAAPWGMRPVAAAEEAGEKVESSTLIPFVASSKTFTFDYPDSWKLAPKLLQTHQEEVRRRTIWGKEEQAIA